MSFDGRARNVARFRRYEDATRRYRSTLPHSRPLLQRRYSESHPAERRKMSIYGTRDRHVGPRYLSIVPTVFVSSLSVPPRIRFLFAAFEFSDPARIPAFLFSGTKVEFVLGKRIAAHRRRPIRALNMQPSFLR